MVANTNCCAAVTVTLVYLGSMRQGLSQQLSHARTQSLRDEDDNEEELDLLFDPVLECYFDPKTCKYYELL